MLLSCATTSDPCMAYWGILPVSLHQYYPLWSIGTGICLCPGDVIYSCEPVSVIQIIFWVVLDHKRPSSPVEVVEWIEPSGVLETTSGLWVQINWTVKFESLHLELIHIEEPDTQTLLWLPCHTITQHNWMLPMALEFRVHGCLSWTVRSHSVRSEVERMPAVQDTWHKLGQWCVAGFNNLY